MRLLEKIAFYILTALPLAYLIFTISIYGFRFPYYDQWELVPLLVNQPQQPLTFTELFAQHNEHRPLFPRLIWLNLARLTNWDISYELALNIILGVLIFTILLFQLKKTAKALALHNFYLLTPLISMMIFSLSQWENWAWGWQISLLLSILSSVFGLFALTNFPSSIKWFIASLLMGIVAVFSFASGISYLVTGLLVMAIYPRNKNHKLKIKLLIWITLGTILITLYFLNFHRPDHHPPYSSLQTAKDFLVYFLVYLGTPLAAFIGPLALILGISCLILALYLPITLVKFIKFEALLPYISLSIFSIINALITGFGRVGFGTIQALSSRYVSFSSLIWISNIVLMYLLFLKLSKGKLTPPAIHIKKIVSFGLYLILFLSFTSSFAGLIQLKYRHASLMSAQKKLSSQTYDQSLFLIYSDQKILLERIDLLKKHHLSVFK